MRLLGIVSCLLLAPIITSRAIGAERWADHDWASIHGSPDNQRYVPFDEINRNSIKELGAIWISEPFPDAASSRMTPLVHQGLMFFGAGPRIFALDARTGKMAWVHQTEARAVPAGGGFEAMTSGLAVSRSFGLGLGGGMLFVGLMNGHVMALSEKTGELIWDQRFNDEPLAVSAGIVSTPLYIDGVLYFGFGSEYARGYMTAVDARSGRLLWQTPTIPEPGQPGHETWPKDSSVWRVGGGTPWVTAAGDAGMGLIYFVTGNPGPFGGAVRPGDNLYSDSVMALEMKTGKLRWYRQLVRHDLWDTDLSVAPVLFDRDYGGSTRKAIGVMRPDGYLFVLDRGTGEPLIPIDERPVPQNPVLATAATQPFPHAADSILPSCETWSAKIPSGFLLGCFFVPQSLQVPNRLAPVPSVRVAPMSYSPQTGYFYAQGQAALQWLTMGDDPYLGDINVSGVRIPNYPEHRVVVAAVDSRTGTVKWRKNLPAGDESGYRSNGGALSTAGGLVFHQGGDGTLQAYDARNGEIVWRFQTDFATGDASPMSYLLHGKQYVAFIAGTKLWAFALGGRLPQSPPIASYPREAIVGPIEDATQIETATLFPVAANGRRYRLNEFAFNPYRTRVRAGAQLTFINNGHNPATIVARDGTWTTGTLGPTEYATLTFDKPGSYVYFSREYPWSYGQLIVTPAASQPDAQVSSSNTNQIAAGKNRYAEACAACHGQDLSGGDRAPALVGRTFMTRWSGRRAIDLFDRMRTTMPPTAPRTLNDETYAAIAAYILSANGDAALVKLDQTTMKDMFVTAPLIPSGR